MSDNGSDDLYECDDVYGNQNHESFEDAIQEAKRRNVSLNSIHAILNKVMVGQNKTDKSDFLSYSKVRDTWIRIGGELEKEHDRIGQYEFLGFDGKKSELLCEHNQVKKSVDKLTFIDQSAIQYVDHTLPESGHGSTIAKCLFDVVQKTNSVQTIKSISSDSPNPITGWENGALRKFEELIENEVQHLHCDLHLNEKLLEKVFIKVDGKTSGPDTWSGVLGSQITAKHGLKRTNMNMMFKPIAGKVEEIKDECGDILQNNDVRHVHDLSLLVQMGPKAAGTRLVNSFFKSVGHVHNARWVTTASNLLILYMQEENPSDRLTLLVKYIVNVYVPTLLNIKKTPHCTNGTRHIFKMVQLSRDLLEVQYPEVFSVVTGCIEDNSYYLHPEQVLLAMVTDPQEEVRNEGIRIIEKFRAQDKYRKEECIGLMKIRVFKKPDKIDFAAKNYYTMVDFDTFHEQYLPYQVVCSPPMLRDYSIDDIRSRNFSDGFKKVPSHSQHVERFVALTSKAAEHAIGYKGRHQWILNHVAASKKVPTSAKKDDFVHLAKQKNIEKVKKKLCTDK